MCHLCSLQISQSVYISELYSDTAGHIYRQALQQRQLSKWDHMKTSSCILRSPHDGILWLLSGPNLKPDRPGEQTIRSAFAHKTNTLLRSMIGSAKPIMWYVETNMFKRNDTHYTGNYHTCFLDLQRTMCAPAFKISKLWWTAVLPCFLAPLPMSQCPICQRRSWLFPG